MSELPSRAKAMKQSMNSLDPSFSPPLVLQGMSMGLSTLVSQPHLPLLLAHGERP